ncbi:hypothetical protein, conserved [Eimeria praecox]|uniref:Uncharacterized protein n=1 Tax=Eimeria praecox TaxID=51316 RepID=U6G0P4_9EIME|nr:hypothetical protein, conserved [Eimeria praecox]
MMEDMAMPSEVFEQALPLPTACGGTSTERASIATLHRRKTKGIPALHWTTVHSPFGNRDRSGRKSFSAASRPVAAVAYCKRSSRAKCLSEGLFDPTFKKDQLESDERKIDLQQRRRMRGKAYPALGLREKVSQVFIASQTHHSQSTDDLSNVNRGKFSSSQQNWKREASLSELLLVGPTFRETIAHEVKTESATNVRRCTFTCPPQEDPATQNKLEHHSLTWTGQALFVRQAPLHERKKIRGLGQAQRRNSIVRIQHRQNRQAEAERNRSSEGAAAPVRATEKFPKGYTHSASERNHLVRSGQPNPLSVARTDELCTSGNQYSQKTSTVQPSDALQAASGKGLVIRSMLPHNGKHLGDSNSTTNLISDCHEKKGTRGLGRRFPPLLSDTIGRVNELQHRVAAAFFPGTVKTELPGMLGVDRKGQLWLEAVIIELAEVLRRGPSEGTKEGKAYLLSFLQQQRGRVLRKRSVLQLLKIVRRRLRQTAIYTSDCVSRDAFASAPTRSLKVFYNSWPNQAQPITQLYADMGANKQQLKSESLANILAGSFHQSPWSVHTSCALIKAGAEDLPPEPTVSRIEEPRKHVQENSTRQSNCALPALDCLEHSTEVPNTKAAQFRNSNDDIRRSLLPQQQRSPLKRKAYDILGYLMRAQEAECHALETLQKVGNLPYASVSQNQPEVSEGRSQQQHTIWLESALCPEWFTSFPIVKEAVELGTSTEKGEATSKDMLQCSRIVLSPAVEGRLLAFREARINAQLNDEPLLQQESLQQALIKLKEDNGGRSCLQNEVAGIWMLHDAIVEQLLDREMKALVCCADYATKMFVDRLFETEAIRMARLMKPAGYKQLRSVAGAC